MNMERLYVNGFLVKFRTLGYINQCTGHASLVYVKDIEFID